MKGIPAVLMMAFGMTAAMQPVAATEDLKRGEAPLNGDPMQRR
jgi:hypothetical protein